MKRIIILIIISFAFSQEAKIDSVAIQAKMVELATAHQQTVESKLKAEDQIKQIEFAYGVLAQMLIPVEIDSVEVENDK